MPATLAALPPIRAAPARACSSFACQAVASAKAGASSFLCHFMSLSGGFASRQYVATCCGSLHPNHWSLTSPGLVPATLAALPPTRAAPARACSSFACQAVALAKAGASSFVCPLLLCPICRKQLPARSRSMSFAESSQPFRSSDRPNECTNVKCLDATPLFPHPVARANGRVRFRPSSPCFDVGFSNLSGDPIY